MPFPSGDLKTQGYTEQIDDENSIWTGVTANPTGNGNEALCKADGLSTRPFALSRDAEDSIASDPVTATAIGCRVSGDNADYVHFGLLFAEEGLPGYGVSVYRDGTDGFLTIRNVAGIFDIITLDDFELPFVVANGVMVSVKAEYNPTTRVISAKAWRTDVDDEPEEWQLVYDDNTLLYSPTEVCMWSNPAGGGNDVFYYFRDLVIGEGGGGPTETPQSCPATVITVATLVARPTFRRTIPATVAAVATETHRPVYRQAVSATVAAVATLTKKTKKTLAATVAAAATVTARVAYKRTLAATVAAVATAAGAARYPKTLSATVTVVATETQRPIYAVVAAATVAAVATLVRKTKKLLSVSVIADASLTGDGVEESPEEQFGIVSRLLGRIVQGAILIAERIDETIRKGQ